MEVIAQEVTCCRGLTLVIGGIWVYFDVGGEFEQSTKVP
jgi:hypothetical protein